MTLIEEIKKRQTDFQASIGATGEATITKVIEELHVQEALDLFNMMNTKSNFSQIQFHDNIEIRFWGNDGFAVVVKTEENEFIFEGTLVEAIKFVVEYKKNEKA